MSNSLFYKANEKNEEWKSHHGSIRVVDFSKTEELKDSYAAMGCITVLTSNGILGTITHLDTTDVANLNKFIKSLDDKLMGHKKTTTVILSGGSALKASEFLYNKVKEKMLENGYSIVGIYKDNTLNPSPKVAILKKDEVLIKEYIYSKNKDQITEISFKDGRKSVSLKNHELLDFVKSLNSKLQKGGG